MSVNEVFVNRAIAMLNLSKDILTAAGSYDASVQATAIHLAELESERVVKFGADVAKAVTLNKSLNLNDIEGTYVIEVTISDGKYACSFAQSATPKAKRASGNARLNSSQYPVNGTTWDHWEDLAKHYGEKMVKSGKLTVEGYASYTAWYDASSKSGHRQYRRLIAIGAPMPTGLMLDPSSKTTLAPIPVEAETEA